MALPDMTRTDAERLLLGLRTRRAQALDAGDFDLLARVDEKVAEVEAALDSDERDRQKQRPTSEGAGLRSRGGRAGRASQKPPGSRSGSSPSGTLDGGGDATAPPMTAADSLALAEAEELPAFEDRLQAMRDSSEAAQEARYGPKPVLSPRDGGSIQVERALKTWRTTRARST